VPAVGRKSKKQKAPSLDQSDQDNQPENDFAPVHLIGDDEIVAETKPAG
jgi:hypothetical protein